MTSPAERRDAAGFTLLETIVVLAILGLILALFASRGADRSPSVELRRTADGLAEGLRFARAEAILRGRPTEIDIGRAPARWSEPGGPATPFSEDIEIKAVTPSAFGASAPTDRIRFETDGSSSGGDITLSRGGRKFLIAVDWLTGRVSVATPQP